jgi:CubicO group peptidase (beta-lactamase class C family)
MPQVSHLFIFYVLLGSSTSNASCPSYQYLVPVSLPSPLPNPILSAFANINTSLSSFLDPISQPGFVCSVFYLGKEVLSLGVGIADKNSSRLPNPSSDLFRIASNTKLFISLLAEVFTEIGYIESLNDPISKYVPSFRGPINTFNDGGEITFFMLMSHTASLPDSLPGGIDWISNITTSQIFEAISKLPVTVPLGTLPSYSNLGISLLGHILAEFIADVSEQGDLDALLNKYILIPLNLTPNTGYNLTSYAIDNLIPAYDSNGNRVPLENLNWNSPCGTMWSTMPSLARFHQTIAQLSSGMSIPGFSLSPTRARSWLQPVSLTPDNSIIMGLPWEMFILPSSDGSFIVKTKSGTLNGYSTKSGLINELQLSFAFSFNGNFKDWYAGNSLLETVASELVSGFTTVLKSLQPPRSAGPKALEYIGVYTQDINQANIANITLDLNGQLILDAPNALGHIAILEYLGDTIPDIFRLYQDPTNNTCEHQAEADTAWAIPIVFSRDAITGLIKSFAIVNWSGDWSKE